MGYFSKSFLVDGEDQIQNESGGHRFQRTPPTERRGRVHTSTVTVSVTENKSDFSDIKESDLKVEWFSGTGKGGQNRNKTQNCCRLTHLPTGLSKSAQYRDRKSSYQNALKELKELVLSQYKQSVDKKLKNDIMQQVGSGQRADKRRTYRQQDGWVTDHVTGKKAPYEKVINGEFELLWR